MPLKIARAFAFKYGVTLLLKGPRTIIAAPDGKTAHVNPTGNCGMASAGSGDVLAGIISSFAVQGVDPYIAAVSGAYVHGSAGDCGAAKYGKRALSASNIIEHLADALKSFEGEDNF